MVGIFEIRNSLPTWSLGISTKNENCSFSVVSPGFNDGRHSLWHGLLEGIEVFRGDLSPDLERNSFQTYASSDLN